MECESDSQLTSIPLGIAIESTTGQDHNHPSTRQIPCERRRFIEISITFIFVFQHQLRARQQRLAGRIMEWIHQRLSL